MTQRCKACVSSLHGQLFVCKIIDNPRQVVHEDDQVIAFRDINPQAPTHVLVVPKRHVATLNDVTAADHAMVGHMVTTAAAVARSRVTPRPAGARCGTSTPPPGRPSSTFTCTCWAGGHWAGRPRVG